LVIYQESLHDAGQQNVKYPIMLLWVLQIRHHRRDILVTLWGIPL